MGCEERKEEISLVLRNDVYQSNPLIQARKTFDLLGMKVFMLGLCGLNPHFSEKDKFFDSDFREIFIPISKLVEMFGNTWYLSELKFACKKLFNAIVELDHADGGFELYHLFRKLKYVPSEGLYIWFDDLLRPYILDLIRSKGYTRINVEHLFKLSSPYAIRLLELLLQYQNIKSFKKIMEIKRKLTIEELRFALNVSDGAYKNRMDNFRKFVLDNPIKEINTRTPYIVSYKPIKDGRNIVAFEFIMDTYNVPKEDDAACKFAKNRESIRALCSLGFTEETAQAIFAKCQDESDCFSRINRAQAILARSKKPVRNKLGFLRKAIEGDWQVVRAKAQKTELHTSSTKDQAPTSIGDSMTPIGEILGMIQAEKNFVPTEPQLIKIGKKQMSRGLAEIFIKYIRQGQMLDNIRENLKYYNTTIEKFTEICAKNGL